MAEAGEEQREVCYSGRVQGVGFRYTTRFVARRFAVTGFVRNLPNGRVEVIVEGTRAEIDAFLRAIRAEMGHYISTVEELTHPFTGQFQDFEVRF